MNGPVRVIFQSNDSSKMRELLKEIRGRGYLVEAKFHGKSIPQAVWKGEELRGAKKIRQELLPPLVLEPQL